MTTEETANTSAYADRGSSAALRNANAAPRAMIPSAAMPSGTQYASLTAANASGNEVQATTSMKISHTWLVSHTGPIACSITSCSARRCRDQRAARCQSPAPKSAPPSSR